MKKENPFTKFKYLFIFLLISGGFFIFSQSAKALPFAPGDLTAVGNYLAGRYQVNLEWQYNQPTEIDGFYIYRNLVNIAVVDNNTTTFIDTTVEYELGITYDYYVTAYNNEGESEPSNTATIITANSPNIPSQLKVEGFEGVSTSTEDFTPEFSWLYSDTENTPMGAYQIQVCEGIITGNLCPDNQMIWDSGKISLETPVSSPNTATVSYNDANGVDDNLDSHGHPLDWSTPTSEHQYHWRVRVWNTDEQASLWSEEGPVFSYSDSVTDNLIFSDDFTTMAYKSSLIPFGYYAAEWYTNAKGEVRIPYQWTLNGNYVQVYDNPAPTSTVAFNAPAIAVDKQNRVHVAFMEDTDGNIGTTRDGQLKYAIFKNGVQESLENINRIGNCGYNVSLILDDFDNPHLSYFSCYTAGDYADLVYGYNNGSQWTTSTKVTDINSQAIYSKTSIAVDSNNYPHISYHRWTTGQPATDGVYYIYQSAAGWSTPERIDNNYQRGSANAIILDSNNNFHIAYNQTGDWGGINRGIYYATGQTTWTTTTIDNASCTKQNCFGQVAIDLDSANIPYFSYRVKEDDNTYLLKHAKYEAGSPVIETAVDTDLTGIWSTSIRIYSNVTSTIAYTLTNSTLRYVSNPTSTASWLDQELINDEGIQVRFAGQTLDNSDLPYIGFSDNAQQKIFYQKHTFSNTNNYAITSTNVNQNSNTIYGVRFHASFSKPGGVVGSVSFKVTADGTNWVDPEDDQPGCPTTSEGCTINFTLQGAGNNENWAGNDLRWQAFISTTDQNYSPRLGSIAFEVYNIPPLITGCGYNPPAIDPIQFVGITAYVLDEYLSIIQTRWCYDEGAPGGGQGECPDPPSIDYWTDWLDGSSVSHQYMDAGIYNPEVQAKDSVGQESNIFMCDNLFVGNVMISWLNTQYGNIYAKEGFHTYGVPCELCGGPTGRNATYLLVTKTGAPNVGFTSECKYNWQQLGLTSGEDCIEQLVSPYNFPKYSFNFRNALGDLKADPMIKQLLENPSEAPFGFPASNFIDVATNEYAKDVADVGFFMVDPITHFQRYPNNVFYIKNSNNGEIPLNGPNQGNAVHRVCLTACNLEGFNNAEYLSDSGKGLFIVDGDLHIYSGFDFDENGNPIAPSSTPRIIYDNSITISQISYLASAAFIIKGDLIIDPDIQELSGTFIVLGDDNVSSCAIPQGETLPPAHCGAIYTANRGAGDRFTPVNERKQLRIYGLVMAKRFYLNRYYIDWLTNLPAETFINDGRALLNPPPGLEDLISSLPNWQTKITP